MPRVMLAEEANRAGLPASHYSRKADGFLKDHLTRLLRCRSGFDGYARLRAICRRAGTTCKQQAEQRQGSSGGYARIAAREKARVKGRKFPTGAGLLAEWRAGPLSERGARRLGRDTGRDGGLGRHGPGRGGGEERGGSAREEDPCAGAGAENRNGDGH